MQRGLSLLYASERTIFLLIAAIIALTSAALGQPNISSEIASAGKLRVGMIAITVLGGVADPVARFIGSKLEVTVEPVMYPSPGAYAQSFGRDEWDIAIGPRALAPGEKSDSTADIWTISLVYVAAPGKEFADIAAVDKPGVKIGTIQGGPSDRILTREIRSAEIVRIPLSPRIATDAAEMLRTGRADVFGADSGVGYPAAEALPGAKVVPGVFATVRVAAALPKGRSSDARAKLEELIAEAKRTGVVQHAIDAKTLKGVSVAPQ
jgi:polar amino acid transport system substrate-binding protein